MCSQPSGKHCKVDHMLGACSDQDEQSDIIQLIEYCVIVLLWPNCLTFSNWSQFTCLVIALLQAKIETFCQQITHSFWPSLDCSALKLLSMMVIHGWSIRFLFLFHLGLRHNLEGWILLYVHVHNNWNRVTKNNNYKCSPFKDNNTIFMNSFHLVPFYYGVLCHCQIFICEILKTFVQKTKQTKTEFKGIRRKVTARPTPVLCMCPSNGPNTSNRTSCAQSLNGPASPKLLPQPYLWPPLKFESRVLRYL